MISYTKRNIYVLTFLITVFLYLIILFCFQSLNSFFQSYQESSIKDLFSTYQGKVTPNATFEHGQESANIPENITKQEEMTMDSAIQMAKQSKNMWELYIPKIQLVAPIEETTNKSVMDRAIGHFETTSILDGNIGLAGHNRGYPVNYFENLKALNKGDSILYKTAEAIRRYEVEIITVIKDTDWTYLEATEDNRITLITCVENEPEYRRCVQAIQKEVIL